MIDERESRIRERAYRIWQEEGAPEGRDIEHWTRAEQDIDQDEPAPDPGEDVSNTVKKKK